MLHIFSVPTLRSVKQVTLLIPTFNVAGTLERCIDSCQGLYDELLIVDSWSSDATLAIAERFGARIIQRDYEHSASQKNWAIPQASHSWILLLDADEWLRPELHDELAAWRESDALDPHDGYWIYRANHFLGRRVRFSGWQGDKVIRLFQRDRCRYAPKQVHSEIEATGPHRAPDAPNEPQHVCGHSLVGGQASPLRRVAGGRLRCAHSAHHALPHGA